MNLFRRTAMRFLFPDIMQHTVKLLRDYREQNLVLAEAYMVLDRIALRDDSPPRELSKMANDFIVKHKLTVKYFEPTKGEVNGR